MKTAIHLITNPKQSNINEFNTEVEHTVAHNSYLNCLELEQNVSSQNIVVDSPGLNTGLYITGPCCLQTYSLLSDRRVNV